MDSAIFHIMKKLRMETGGCPLQHILEKYFIESGEELENSHQKTLSTSLSLDVVICLIVGGAALCFDLYRLETPSIWFDEALSIERARQSLPVLWKIISTTQENMALYYLVLHYWLSFTSLLKWLPTEAVVRFPSAIFASLSAIVIYLFGRRFMGRTVGLISAGLYVINVLQLTYAQETRSYSMQLLLVCCSWYALFAAQTDRQQKRWWACYTIVTALTVYTQLFSVFIILAQAITYCCLALLSTSWQKQVRHRYRSFIVSLIGICIATLPILIAARHSNKTGWLPAPQLSDILYFLTSIAGHNKAYLLALSLACVLSVLGIFLTRMKRPQQLMGSLGLTDTINRVPTFATDQSGSISRALAPKSVRTSIDYPYSACVSPRGTQKTTIQHSSISSARSMNFLNTERIQSSIPIILAMLCWFVIPLIISYGISQGSMRLFSTRYLVIIVPPVLYLVALGIESLSQRRIRSSLVAVLFVLASFSVPSYYQSAQVEDWKQTTLWLQSHYQANDGITCYNNAQGCQLDIEYYLRAYPQDGITFPADSPGSFPWANYDLTNRIETDPGLAVDPTVLAAYGKQHSRIFFVIARLSGQENVARAAKARYWLDSHYGLVDQIVTRTVTIRLYQTGSSQH